MFQYAMLKNLSKRHNVEMRLDLSFLQRAWAGYIKKRYDNSKFINFELYPFFIEENFLFKNDNLFSEKIYKVNKYFGILLFSILSFLQKNHYREQKFNFDDTILNLCDGYFEWYFQSEKYFIDNEDIIRGDFNFKLQPSEENIKIIELIEASNSISLHIRRGDYISNPNNAFYNTCDLEYYKKAISLMCEKTENPIFFVFSDDMAWTKANLDTNHLTYYVDVNDNQHNYEDMRLMSQCKHNIIANSSFSWWWAWLNQNPDKIVIAPDRWFVSSKIDYSDVVPDSWIKIA